MINIRRIGILMMLWILVMLWGFGWSVYVDVTGAPITITNIVIAFGPIIIWFLCFTWFVFFVCDD